MARRRSKRRPVKLIALSQTQGDRVRALSLLYAQGTPPPPLKGRRVTALTPCEIEAQQRRQILIHRATPAEVKFQSILKGLNIQHSFQVVVHVSESQYYIMDFVVPHRKPHAIFEIDGGIHADQVEYDDRRTERILCHRKYRGFQVIRFTNEQVFNGEAYRAVQKLYCK